MPKGKPIEVIKESSTGRNIKFRNKNTGETMSLPTFVKKIELGQYPEYHNRKINGINTPVSNPDGKPGNNLG